MAVSHVMLETFLELSGTGVPVGDAKAVIAVLRLAVGDMTGDALTGWVRSHTRLPP